MRIATGDAVVLLDGDLQDPPELIAAFRQVAEGYDVVYGERVRREAPGSCSLLYKVFLPRLPAPAYVAVPLDAGDFSLIDRRVVDALNALPESNRFLRGLRAWVGFQQIGVQYVRPERMFGRTTNSFRKNLGWARRAIVSFSYAPLDIITGLALTVVGALVPRPCWCRSSCAWSIPRPAPQGPDDVDRPHPLHRRHPAPVPEHHRRPTSPTSTTRSRVAQASSSRSILNPPEGAELPEGAAVAHPAGEPLQR